MKKSVAELRFSDSVSSGTGQIRNVSAKKVNVGSVKGRNLLAEKSKDVSKIQGIAKRFMSLAKDTQSLAKDVSKIEEEVDALDAGSIVEDIWEDVSDLWKLMRKLGPALEDELMSIADKLEAQESGS